MSDKIISNIESQINVLKVYIHDLKMENKKLKAKIKRLYEDLSNFLKIEKSLV